MPLTRNDWTTFLDEQVKTQVEQHYPDDAPLLFDLPTLGSVRVSGDDALEFLQNQFCNDVKLINDNFTQLNGYCSPKGRLIAFFRLFKQPQAEEAFYLTMPVERIAATIKRLQMFVMMSKVTLADTSDEFISIGLAGQQAEALLNQHTKMVPDQTDTCVQWNALTIIRVPGNEPRFQISGGIEPMRSLWTGLSANAKPAADSSWLLMDIDAGIPQVVDATAEAFVPQMLNLQSINALSFKKGCYPGQEIVARMHYLGKQKRSMFLAETGADLKPGDSIFEATGDSPKEPAGQSVGTMAGTVVSAAPTSTGSYRILAVLQIKSAKNARLSPENHQNIPLNLKDLPYPAELEGDGK